MFRSTDELRVVSSDTDSTVYATDDYYEEPEPPVPLSKIVDSTDDLRQNGNQHLAACDTADADIKIEPCSSDVEKNIQHKSESGMDLLYTIEENPPWHLTILLGLQHYLTMVGATIAIPFILAPALCIQPGNLSRVHLLSTIFFTSGLATFLQSTFGNRLPIVQGGTFSLIPPALALLNTQYPACSTYDFKNMTYAEEQEVWMTRMRDLQGSIIVASLFEIIVGFTGIIGVLVSVITPLTIAPTICLVGLSLFEVAANEASTHWGVAAFTIVLIVVFSQYLRNVPLPLPGYSRGKGWFVVKANIFGLFPVLLSILISWAFCAILTSSGALAEDSAARTDKAYTIISDSPWFRVPYPGQWGLPSVSVAGVAGILAGLCASIVESIGDYYACARLSGAPPLPKHAINRGIGMEGVGSMLAGLWGSGNGTTSYGENIGAIAMTKIGSRRVIQAGAIIMMVFGMFSKFAGLFMGVPTPVIGGLYLSLFGIVAAVGLSNLQYVNMNSSRNLFVSGFSIFFGLAIPNWLKRNPVDVQVEGFVTIIQIGLVLLRTPMFVGGLLAAFLDNTIPGTPEERGLLKWQAHLTTTDEGDDSISDCYDFPFGMDFIKRKSWLSKVPFCPTFAGWNFRFRRGSKKT